MGIPIANASRPAVTIEGNGTFFTAIQPEIFELIRGNFNISEEEYHESLQDIRSRLNDGGRSGSSFYETGDGRFLVKSLVTTDSSVLERSTQALLSHYQESTYSLLTHIYGHYKTQYDGRVDYYIVMNNILATKLHIDRVFDLKGSILGRSSEDFDSVVLKDNDLKEKIELDSEIIENIMEVLASDTRFLLQCNVMDYSLLLGIHDLEEDIGYSHVSDGLRVLQGVRENAEGKRSIYFIGLIDFFQEYSTGKMVERGLKTILFSPGDEVSSVDPVTYRERFLARIADVFNCDETTDN